MKALTFLELYINQDISYENSLYELINANKNHISEIAQFYSQPFKPELIEQLFEGWIINRLKQYANNECRIDIHKNHIEYNNGYKLFYFLIPTTLNDFISDCQRAWIELTFKEAK